MKRRILSAFLALAMVVSIMPSALAAKKQAASTAGANIYEDLGSFETQAQADKMNFSNAKGTVVSGGYKGNCVKVEVTNDWGGMRFLFPAVIGESYDISFWMKTDDAPAAMSPIVYYDSGYNVNMFPSGQFTNSWTKYSATVDFDGSSNQGLAPQKGKEVDIRYGNGQQKASYYIDEMVIVPHGKIKDADYSSLKLKTEKVTVKEDNDKAPRDVTPVAFSDMENHWAKNTVNQLATYGYINGMGENTYAPNENVTRAQFTKMMTDTFDMAEPKYNADFSDIKGDEWFAPSVSLAAAVGLIDPAMTFGNRFLPDQAITREEAASIAAKMAEHKKAEKKEAGASFTDEAAISTWAKAGVKDAAEYGLIKGYEDGSYKPEANITRAEAATILKRVAEFTTLFAIYVDAENGNDKNDGTEHAPYKTIYAAQKRVRQVNKTMTNDIFVYIRGEHYMDRPLEFGVEDSGFNNYRVIYTSWDDEQVKLTAGKRYTGFQMHDEDKNIYKLFVGPMQTRQVYFNNVRGIRARTVAGLENPKFMNTGSKFIYGTDDTSLLDLAYPLEIEGVWHNNWRHDYMQFESIQGADDGTVQLTLPAQFTGYRKSYFENCTDHRKFPTFLENAYEFLDQPSEWYLDNHAGYLYYIPREGEDMSTMVATIPVGERLLTVNGNSGKDPVRNLTFNNIEFADTGWNAPTTAGGLATNQNYSFNGGSLLMYSALHIKDAHYIDFTNNKIVRIGSSGLQTSRSIQHCNFMGNEFTDISGGGMSFGAVVKTDLGAADPHLTDDVSEWNAWNKVHSNFFYGTGLQYKGCAVLSVSWPRHTTISHNYIGTSPYSGMHTGWGWGSYASKGTNTYDLEISYNYYSENVNDRLYDGASIYMLASTSLEAKGLENNNLLKRNYFENPRNAYGAVYPDEGSAYWHVTENVVNMSDVNDWMFNYHDIATYSKDEMYWGMLWAQTCLHNTVDENYTTLEKYRNTTGSTTNTIVNNHVYPDADWPEEAQKIIEEAYIEPEYIENFDRRNGPLSFASRKREYVVPLGEQVPLDFKIYGNYMKEYDPKDFDIDYWVSDPDKLTVDENGVMTAHGTGEVWVVANANINGFIQIKEYRILAGEKFEELNTNLSALSMLNGYSSTVTVEAVTTFGNKEMIDPSKISFEIADTNVATVSAEGVVTAHSTGETVLKVTATDKGFTIEKEIPIRVISLSQPDTMTLPYEPAPASMFTTGAWTGTAVSKGNGISVTGSPAYNLNMEDGKLYAFDMVINSNTGWPSLALCASERMGSYIDSDTYMIGFKADHIEFQRFNMGERTMIFGDASFKPVGGPGIPNDANAPIYKHGERISVVVGAMPHPKGGTRVVLTINGKNVFDYHDNDTKACKTNGFFGVYDNFEFYPYTGPELGAAE
ncbi:MAG: S-layer homology domain-containing protein [Clostridia bacterium]|nr:S-layer homology domain-containing protein [Clostridia bacterium]